MAKVKRILMIADFKSESPKSIRFQPRMWMKGLLRLGCDVQCFSYSNIMFEYSPFHSKKIARKFGKKKTDILLENQIKDYYPDIVFIYSMKNLDTATVSIIRDAAPDAILVGRDEDPFPDKNPARLAIARQTDIVMTTSAGRFLQSYKDAGVPCCAFVPDMCDPDIQYKCDVEEKWKADIIFTGKPEHTRLDRNNERYNLVQRLSHLDNARIYGAFGIPRVEGVSYFRAISGAKIGLNINIANDVQLYHSDRFINYIGCGTFVLARRAPDTDLLFKDGVHVKYFDSEDEFFELADWYLKHDHERVKIANAGIARAHAEFNCEKIAKSMLDLIETGTYEAPWAVIL